MLLLVAGGVMSLLGALTYAELAAANPEAGGLYCYTRDGFGRLPAFLYGWCLFLVISAATIAELASGVVFIGWIFMGWARQQFSSARGTWGTDESTALSRTRISVDADCVFAGVRGSCWECDFSGESAMRKNFGMCWLD